jgi:prolyl-tRNA editing enzyme YbaK/EbsC (Cys-tRNA(Pro) deacylase)
LCYIPAYKKLDVRRVKEIIGWEIRYSTRDEFWKITGLVLGTAPPFGEILGVPLFVDTLLFEGEKR